MTIRPGGATPLPPDEHTCPWPRCGASIPVRYLMCAPHWRRLPAELRARVNRAYRPGQTILTASPAWRLAVTEALMHARRVAMFDPAPRNDEKGRP